MPQYYDKFPKTCVGTNQQEQIWRDWQMFNIHINSHKMRWLKDVTDILDCHRFEDDFCNCPDTTFTYYLYQWPGTSGIETLCCTDAVNGVLDMLTGPDDDDQAELTQYCECWKCVNCYPFYGEIRFWLDDDDQNEFWFGYIQNHSWFAGTQNAIVFHKDDGDQLLDFDTTLAGVTTTTTGIATMTQCTWYRLGIHWDGSGTVRYFLIQDGNFPQTILATGSHTTNIPTTELAFGFGLRNGEAVAKNLYVDYIKSAQLRVIE